jgi:dihydroxyacetone kinase phosphotransfer subunit
MIGIVLVSHSHLLSAGLQEMAIQMSRNMVKIAAAGGVDDETVGTNAERIQAAIQEVYSPDGVLVLFDLGSALLSTQMAIEMFPLKQQAHIKLSNAPMVEGAIVAAVEASLGHDLEQVNIAAEAAKDMQKIM